jgi:S1-C subfamily serine protease
LGELPEGTVSLEAFAADLGRGSVENVRVSPGRPTSGVRIVITREANRSKEPNASGNVAVTLGVTEDGAVVLSSVVEGSAAERAGLAEGDRLLKVDGAAVHTMDDARAKLAGPVQDDVVIGLKRGERTLTLRVPREASRR